MSQSRMRSFDRGETVCLQGEAPSSLKVVLAGWAKCYRVSPQGEEAVLATLTNGDSFDEIAALNKRTCFASVEAVTDCALLFVNLDNIRPTHWAYGEINRAVLGIAADHMQKMMSELERMKVNTTTERLADYLVDMVEVRGKEGRIILPFEKVILASVLGMKPESLSRAFRALKKVGVHSHLKEVFVEDIERLRACKRCNPMFA
ncbi:MAG: Crp/Fnr family transcriptional regulator [Pseudopelagicola sp.]|nr:Crp/Fnr family transcriptional regulator [Pseudopelagicola sp.]